MSTLNIGKVRDKSKLNTWYSGIKPVLNTDILLFYLCFVRV